MKRKKKKFPTFVPSHLVLPMRAVVTLESDKKQERKRGSKKKYFLGEKYQKTTNYE